MNFAKLLLDPRGVIGRQAFADGLLALAAIIALALVTLGVLAQALSWSIGDLAMALTPLLGTSLLVTKIVAANIENRAAPELIAPVLLMGARLYVLACLCLKRLRDAGRGPSGLIIAGAMSLGFHVLMGQWAQTLLTSEMGELFPPLIDVTFNLLLWGVFLLSLLVNRSRRNA